MYDQFKKNMMLHHRFRSFIFVFVSVRDKADVLSPHKRSPPEAEPHPGQQKQRNEKKKKKRAFVVLQLLVRVQRRKAWHDDDVSCSRHLLKLAA